MSRSIVLHICLAFCSLLFLSFATQCLAFPKMERREIEHDRAEKEQTERTNVDDQENSSIILTHMPQIMVSEDPIMVSAGPSVTPLNTEFSVNKETQPEPNSPSLYTATEPVVPVSEEVFGSSQSEGMSPESRLSNVLLTTGITAPTSLNVDDKKEPVSSTSVHPIAEGTTDATQGFPKYVDSQLFATESQEGVSLGHSPSSYISTEEMLATNPRTEKFETDTDQRTTSFPDAESTADTEPASLLSDGEKPSQMTADNTQATATEHLPEYTLSVESETDSLLGAPEVTVSDSTAVPAASVLSDEWDDTKLERVSQVRTPQLRDNTETQERIEPSQTAHVSPDRTEGDQPWTEAEGGTHMGMTLLLSQGDETSPAFTHPSSFTPTSLMEDTKASIVSVFQSTGGSMESTKENGARFFTETTVSMSEHESEAYQLLKDIITQEMTTLVEETEGTLPLVTQEQVATIEVPRDSSGPEEGKESPSPVSDGAGVTQLSRRWEPLATAASATVVPWSLEVTPAEDLMDTVTEPNEEFIPVLGSPVTPPGITEEALPSVSPALPVSEAPFERRTVPSISHPNTAASYGLDQLESEEGEEDEDEEDEEDEDEEEEDEEEDEEDKDTDSLDESFDGDTELPGFTLPGMTSQEPGLEQGNMDPLEGATYQVPDVIEWEQQNQGLVRSWMEKLKDKAGYMSGMLVPVGVGIAGALFILGALYSIKVMNRRRRNGFKRHKRKQREFNSMQDRVMLLADSSEDEF